AGTTAGRLVRPGFAPRWAAGLGGVLGWQWRPVRQGERDSIGDLLTDLVPHVGPDHQLEEDAALELFDRVDDLLTTARRGAPLGVDPTGGWNLDLQVGVAEPSLPCHRSCCFQAVLLGLCPAVLTL